MEKWSAAPEIGVAYRSGCEPDGGDRKQTVDQGPIKAFYLAGDVAMATLMRATRLFVAVATIAIPSAGAFAGGPSTPVTPSVGSPSQARVEFTRPGGIP